MPPKDWSDASLAAGEPPHDEPAAANASSEDVVANSPPSGSDALDDELDRDSTCSISTGKAEAMRRMPRRLRRRAERENAKRNRRAQAKRDQLERFTAAQNEMSVQERRDALVKQAAFHHRVLRKSRKTQEVRSPEAMIDPGLVIVRGNGEPYDDEVMFSVGWRVSRHMGVHNEIAVFILDGPIYDAIPINHRDPFEELRSSPLTGRNAPEEVFATTALFYMNALGGWPITPIMGAEHSRDLLEQIHDALGSDAWKLPDRIPPLSFLAQRVLVDILLRVKDAVTNAEELIPTMRRMVDHGRLLELIDPRDGAF